MTVEEKEELASDASNLIELYLSKNNGVFPEDFKEAGAGMIKCLTEPEGHNLTEVFDEFRTYSTADKDAIFKHTVDAMSQVWELVRESLGAEYGEIDSEEWHQVMLDCKLLSTFRAMCEE